jgi:sugar lactone lactonase YvrE
MSAPLLAQGTKLWTQSRFEEFEKGTPQGVAIGSDGRLVSGPVASEVLTTPSSFVWSVAVDKAGIVYLATGAPATVLRVTPDGKSSKLLESKALAVQALHLGPDGALYAATIPDGKVYRLKPDAAAPVDEASAQVVFDLGKMDGDGEKAAEGKKPEEKSHYIWDMTEDSMGRLYIATGGPGAVYRLNVSEAQPKAEVFFKSDEQHVRTLAWDKQGNLLAGTDGSGLVYRIDPKGKGYVLFSAPRREITALAVGADGTIYAADVGDKNHNPLPQLPVQAGAGGITITFVNPASVQAANASTALPDGTEVYALTPDQAPRKLWSDKDDVVYQLASTADGVMALTGNRGRIFTIHTDGSYDDIAHLEAQQAVALAATANGWLVGTANTGKLYRLESAGGSGKAAHEYASDVLDAGALTRWGLVEVDPESHGYRLFTRSGNVEQPVRSAKDWGWSEWQPVAGGKVASPPGRYLQWKAELNGDGVLRGVGINYLTVNAAPAVDDVLVVPGARFIPQAPQSQPATVTIAFPAPAQSGMMVSDGSAASQPIQAQKDRTAVTVRWNAHDDNGDDLVYDLYLRGDGEHVWRLLKKGRTEKVYSFDGSALPDGGYQIRVVASDAPSHGVGEALTGELTSDRFELDTTAPMISDLQASKAVLETCKPLPCTRTLKIPVSFDAKDAMSPIGHAEYSVDAGPWQYVEPVGALSDSKEEHYSFSVPLPVGPDGKTDGSTVESNVEHLISVRAYDRHENMATAKVIVPASNAKAGAQ